MKITIETEGGFAGLAPPPLTVHQPSEEIAQKIQQLEEGIVAQKAHLDADAEGPSLMADGMMYTITIADGERTTTYQVDEGQCPSKLLEILDEIREYILEQPQSSPSS
ncbi:MAG TPA: hypothetical protein DCE42_09290 [Myxococcales bacterium]|nr:hypothetical protein [Deltaproteobacteria bacterium]HAA54939.1 hypothetical protein [Myxococcales bacterium]|tara:strand:+ start:2126 stop:2449 length:324 start_codon:yes stop_codon:yes gene_type:complete